MMLRSCHTNHNVLKHLNSHLITASISKRPTRALHTYAKSPNMVQFYELSHPKPKGEPLDFNTLKGKVVLVFNSASKCGFTEQLGGLEELHKKYKDQGLVVLGFPCNQFAGQEPENDEGIESFCQLNYGVSFTMLAKSDVNGSNTNDVFKYLKSQKSGLLGTSGSELHER